MKEFEFSPDKALKLYEKKQYHELTQEFVKFIDFYSAVSIAEITPSLQTKLEIISSLIFSTLITEDYIIPEEYVLRMVTASTLLGNLAAITNHKTTDKFLLAALKQKGNVPKVLALYNHRCKTRINLAGLFGHSAQSARAASWWWAMLLDQARAVTPEEQNHLEAILNNEGAHKYFVIADDFNDKLDWITHPAFAVSYISPDSEPALRGVVNRELQKIAIKRTKEVTPNFKKILVVSASFRKEHAVYKSIAEYFKSLKPGYHLTLLNINPNQDAEFSEKRLIDTDLFDDVVFLMGRNGKKEEAIQLLQEGDFGMIIYPDVALTFNADILANTRLAPIQISTYGHPVSTYASEIDYFIGGAATETPETYGNYTERLILLPGQGNCPVTVQHEITMMEHLDYMISCSWGYLKLNWPMVEALKEIKDKAQRPVKFVLSGIQGQSFAHAAIRKDLENYLGAESLMITGSLSRKNYMRHIEICRLGIDSFPFGGFNRVIDTLLCHKPIVIQEGNKAYNRMNAAMMRRIGLDELIASNRDELISKSLEIINNEDYRQSLIEKIKLSDFFATSEAIYFRKAVDFLIDNHAALQTFKNNKPIFIKDDSGCLDINKQEQPELVC